MINLLPLNLRRTAFLAAWLGSHFLLPDTPSWADQRIGNGGFVITCDQPDGSSTAELLDYWEYQHLLQDRFALDLGPTNLAYVDKLALIWPRLARLDPQRSQRYEQALYEMDPLEDRSDASRAITFTDGELDPVDDVSPIFTVPANCQLKMAAKRFTESPHPDVGEFLINNRLWNMLSQDHRAGLLLHEIIYSENADQGHPNSRFSRAHVAMLSSPRLSQYSEETYQAYLETTGQADHTLPLFGLEAAEDLMLVLHSSPVDFATAEQHCFELGHGLFEFQWENTPFHLERYAHSRWMAALEEARAATGGYFWGVRRGGGTDAFYIRFGRLVRPSPQPQAQLYPYVCLGIRAQPSRMGNINSIQEFIW